MARASAVTDRFFGMHAPSLPSAFPTATVGALNLTTNGVYWPQLQSAPGVFDFTRLDAVVNAARAHNAQPLLVLGQTPGFASTTPHAANVPASVPTMAAWKAYVTKVV